MPASRGALAGLVAALVVDGAAAVPHNRGVVNPSALAPEDAALNATELRAKYVWEGGTTCQRCLTKGAHDWCWRKNECYTSGPNPLDPCHDSQCASSSMFSFCDCKTCADQKCASAAPPPPVPPNAQGFCDTIQNNIDQFHKLHGLTDDTCKLTRCVFPQTDGVQIDCDQIKLLFYDTLSLNIGMDLCSPDDPSVTIDFTEKSGNINFHERFSNTEPKDYPVPGAHVSFPQLAEADVCLDVGMLTDGPYVDLSIGLDICGNILGKHFCAKDFLSSVFPWDIFDEKMDISEVCHGIPPPPPAPAPPPGPAPAPPAPPGHFHYEDPSKGPCIAGEEVAQLPGISGKFCSPTCSAELKCPIDLPPPANKADKEATASPLCVLDQENVLTEALESAETTHCAMICAGGLTCPDGASCKTYRDTQICTYDSR